MKENNKVSVEEFIKDLTNSIFIIKMPDGNWKGYMNKNGMIIEVRQGDPNTVLNMLITAE